jgi:hypothetical protein
MRASPPAYDSTAPEKSPITAPRASGRAFITRWRLRDHAAYGAA